MYVTTGSGSSGKCGGGGKGGGREEFPRHQETLATTTAMAMATRTSKSDSFDEKLTKTTLHV